MEGSAQLGWVEAAGYYEGVGGVCVCVLYVCVCLCVYVRQRLRW